MKRTIAVHAKQLVTCGGAGPKKGAAAMNELGIIEDGAVLMEDGVIVEAGPTAALLPRCGNAEIIDCTGKAVLPGFVDPHTHFIFGGYRAEEFSWRLTGVSYMDIMQRGGGINATVGPTRAASEDELMEEGRKRLDSMLRFGVTTAEGKSGYGLDTENELKQLRAMARLQKEHPVDVIPTFMGAHATPEEYKGRTGAYVDYIIEEMLPAVAAGGLAEFCDVFCEAKVFEIEDSRRLLKAAKKYGMIPKLHADEIVPIGGTELAAEVGAVSADHLLHASDEGIRRLAEAGVVATLLPATAFSLKEPYARGRFMIDEGCAVALASDYNPGSCFTNSIPLLFALATIYMGLTVEEAITALTLNGAAAIGRADRAGSIEPGKQADLVILKYPDYHFLNYHFAVNIVERVVKAGRVVCVNP